ncbi:hypothetical protein Areg01_73710 [Actinoplanes regularis]|nr:hypothetical protein Areg01_73710 [Actinoplanes regularis]
MENAEWRIDVEYVTADTPAFGGRSAIHSTVDCCAAIRRHVLRAAPGKRVLRVVAVPGVHVVIADQVRIVVAGTGQPPWAGVPVRRRGTCRR